MSEKFKVSLIIEILGRPQEHVKESLIALVDRLGTEKGVKITSKTLNEPLPVEKAQDLFTSFAEIDAELDSLEVYFGIIFAYMPAHIEIISPEKVNITNAQYNELGNKLIQRLHEYDSITKGALAEKEFLARKLYEFAPHLFKKENPVSDTSTKKE